MEKYIFETGKVFTARFGEWYYLEAGSKLRYNFKDIHSNFHSRNDVKELFRNAYSGQFLEDGRRYMTTNKDLQLVWYAFDDHKKMAYLPAKFVEKYHRMNDEQKRELLQKKGKMLSYGKFCDKFNTTWFPQPCVDELTIETGIVDVYNDESNIGSCMTGKEDLTYFYEQMKCSILVARNCDGKVTGRAIIWNNPILVRGEKSYPALLDRCYAVSNELKSKMVQFAIDKGWDVRTSDEAYFSPFESGNHYKIECVRDYDIPWLDTMRHYEDGYINNYSGYVCQNTSGTDITAHICDHCGCQIDEDETCTDEMGNIYCPDCVVYSDRYNDYILRDDAVYIDYFGTYVLDDDDNICRVCGHYYAIEDDAVRYDELNEEWILTCDSVWCESEEITTHIDSAWKCNECGEWFTDAISPIEYEKFDYCENCYNEIKERVLA